MNDRPILSRPIDVSSIPSAGLTREIVATAAERQALATAYGLVDVRSLTAEFLLESGGHGVVAVDGRVKAEIAQNCVVSLVPVDQSIDEPIEARFVLSRSRAAPLPRKPGGEVMLDSHLADGPELLHGSLLDLGAIALEHFVLAIDPYPRAPGAMLPQEFVDAPADPTDSPFAALAGLRGEGPERR